MARIVNDMNFIEDEASFESLKTDDMIWRSWWVSLLVGSNASYIDWSK